MAPKYFAFIDGNQQGPFDLYDLKSAGVRPSTYVWCKGMDDWKRADEVEEIRNLFRRHLEDQKEQSVINPPADASTKEENPVPQPEEKPEQIRFGRIPASVEPEVDINNPPQVSMTLAVLSLILCFPPSGIAAVVFAWKAQKTWEEANRNEKTKEDMDTLKRQSHEYARLAKMWLGLTVAFGIIFWTLIFSVKQF